MINYYLFERLIEYRQKEIEQKARHAWKWAIMKEEKEKKASLNITQPIVNCCPACC
ncbi:hypothetical protein QYF50_07015 [Paenibacillus vini]|nr:hypothetical protein [Paenibacillus vini]